MEGKRKTRQGVVVGRKMDKTAVVAVETLARHPLYNKAVRKAVKYLAHDEVNTTGLGDVVKIAECRPLSKRKRWRVVKVITKGEVAEVQPQEIT